MNIYDHTVDCLVDLLPAACTNPHHVCLLWTHTLHRTSLGWISCLILLSTPSKDPVCMLITYIVSADIHSPC